ncbi:hypothetical protein GCM10010518_07980 [Kitasatospora cinereorecta]
MSHDVPFRESLGITRRLSLDADGLPGIAPGALPEPPVRPTDRGCLTFPLRTAPTCAHNGTQSGTARAGLCYALTAALTYGHVTYEAVGNSPVPRSLP